MDLKHVDDVYEIQLCSARGGAVLNSDTCMGQPDSVNKQNGPVLRTVSLIQRIVLPCCFAENM